MYCETCNKRDGCKAMCENMQKYLYNHAPGMERHFSDKIVVYPVNQEIHFSELPEGMADEFDEDQIPEFSGSDFKLRKTNVFIDRFFNRKKFSEIADQFDIKENTAVKMFSDAVETVNKVLSVMDGKKAGIAMVRQNPDFTESQKMFLLHSVFGFEKSEIAKMFNQSENSTGSRINRMVAQYKDFFDKKELSLKPFLGRTKNTHEQWEAQIREANIPEPTITADMTKQEIVAAVDHYVKRGVSISAASSIVAKMISLMENRPVTAKSIEAVHYKDRKRHITT